MTSDDLGLEWAEKRAAADRLRKQPNKGEELEEAETAEDEAREAYDKALAKEEPQQPEPAPDTSSSASTGGGGGTPPQ